MMTIKVQIWRRKNTLLSVPDQDGRFTSLGPRALKSCPLLLGSWRKDSPGWENAEVKFTATSACVCVCVSPPNICTCVLLCVVMPVLRLHGAPGQQWLSGAHLPPPRRTQTIPIHRGSNLSRNTFLLYSSISEYLYFTWLFFYTYFLLNTAPLHFPYIDVTYVRNNALGASQL